MLVAGDGQRTLATFIHGGRTADIACAVDGDMGIATHHHGSLWRWLRERNHLIISRIDEPFSLTLPCKGVDVDEVGLLRTRLHGELWRIGRFLVALVGTDTNHIGGLRLEI